MSQTLAGTDLSASAVHAVVEIGAAGRLSAKALSEKLLLEKSTVSRLVNSLVEGGELYEVRSETDARCKHLHLTRQGEQTLAAITRFATRQVSAAIAPLGLPSQRQILSGLEIYAAALKVSRTSGTAVTQDNRMVINQGYTPGIIGRIVEMHVSYYSRLAGFGAGFESKVANDLAAFVTRLAKPENEIWYAEKDGRIVGSIAIDGEDLGDGRAHLRWFIVDDGMRGAGVGKALIRIAMTFCDDHSFDETHLWTFSGLDVARALYESNRFSLAEEYLGGQWSTEVLEQRYVRPRTAQL